MSSSTAPRGATKTMSSLRVALKITPSAWDPCRGRSESRLPAPRRFVRRAIRDGASRGSDYNARRSEDQGSPANGARLDRVERLYNPDVLRR
eukprot:100304-Prorocentrum_minimum.AAC.2